MSAEVANLEPTSTREKILSATEQLLRKDPSADFTLKQLAEKLGLHYTAVYHYFHNRDDLEASLIEIYTERRSRLLDEARIRGDSAFTQLMEYVRLVMHESSTSLIIRGRSTLVGPYRRRVIRLYQRNRAELAELINQGVADKSIIPIDPQLAAHLVVRILDRFAYQEEAVFTEAGLTADRLTEELVAFFKGGIAADTNDPGGVLLNSAPRSLLSLQETALEEILRATTIAFNTRGWRKTSIPDVARDLGLSKTSFYRYAASKEELLNQCAHRTLNLIAQIRQVSIAMSDNPLQAVLLDTYLSRQLLDHAPGPLLSPYLFDCLSTEHGRVAWDIYRAYRKVLIEQLRDSVKAGLIRPLSAEAVQPMITAMAYIPFQTSDESQGHADQVMQVLAFGLAKGYPN
ncbi:MAG: TetR/AcrR family transcriptional regulator [Pseudomonadales bacterium]|nr:TetR/AcrR family transcriptional regulator [Pseudomonadales bacterium]